VRCSRRATAVSAMTAAGLPLESAERGLDYDTFAADLNALLEHLDVRDVVLCGFLDGHREIASYLVTYGSARVSRPSPSRGRSRRSWRKTEDNPWAWTARFRGIKAADVETLRLSSWTSSTTSKRRRPRSKRISDQAWKALFKRRGWGHHPMSPKPAWIRG